MTRHTLLPLSSAAFTTALLLSACTADNSRLQSTVSSDQSSAASQTLQESEVRHKTRLGKTRQQVLRQPTLQITNTVAANPYTRIIRDNIAPQQVSTERYEAAADNPVIQTEKESVSTFSIDVDTGSYSNVRRFLQSGNLPPVDAVRVEEMLNYFSYDYADNATVEQPFSVATELGATPWNSRTQLLHIGLKGYVPESADKKPANLVFLIDVSGSMDSPDKLGLLKSSISMLTNELDENDTVSIVVYAGSSGVVLEPTAGDQHRTINKALSRLNAGGSTNGAEGIELAYELASNNSVEGGINRVILATDGDFNVGISDTDQLKRLISEKRESGIAFTTLGFGTGNYNDHLMEQLADTGNGSYAYIDTLAEARKVLVDERHSTMMRIAGDVKIQVEFNPERVSEYRLIGYTNRRLDNEDFNNDKVDAGDIGAGHTVTALYEIALHGKGGEKNTPLRYKQAAKTSSSESEFSDELAEVRLRYKLPDESQSRLIQQAVRDTLSDTQDAPTSDNFRFSASVAALGQLLRENKHMDDFSYQDVSKLARGSKAQDEYGYRSEFIRLVDMAESLNKIERASNGLADNDEG